jgi:hypothetical protein
VLRRYAREDAGGVKGRAGAKSVWVRTESREIGSKLVLPAVRWRKQWREWLECVACREFASCCGVNLAGRELGCWASPNYSVIGGAMTTIVPIAWSFGAANQTWVLERDGQLQEKPGELPADCEIPSSFEAITARLITPAHKSAVGPD